MRNTIRNILTIHAAIFTAGVVLDEAGKGTFGSTVQRVATKITRGFGV